MLVTTWLVLTAFFGYQITKLKVDFEFENFFPTDDPDIQFYENHLSKFAYDNDYLIGILESKGGIFNQRFLEKTQTLCDSLSKIPAIESVFCPAVAKQLVKGPMGTTPISLIHIENPERYPTDSIKLYTHPVYKTFFSSDGKALLIQINHEHFSDPNASKVFNKNLEELFDLFQFDQYRLVGKLVAQDTFVGYIQSDFVLFLALALVLSFIILNLIFKSLKIALLPYLISVTSLIWLLGLMALLGYPISILGSLIPPVILFVSTSDAIHLINAFRNNESTDFIKRLQNAVNKVFIPTLLTSATTAIGFFSLLSIDTAPIQHLGIFAGLGILIAFVVTFLFSPLLINREYPRQTHSHRLKLTALWVLKNQKAIIVAWVVLIALSIQGITQLKTDAYLLKDLPEESQVRKDFNYVDQQFGGSKPWEIAVWAADSSQGLWSYEAMLEVAMLHDHIQTKYPMHRIMSPVTLLKYANQMLNGGLNESFRFPAEKQFRRVVAEVKRLQKREILPKLMSEDGQYGRIAGFIPEYGSKETILRNNELMGFIDASVDPSLLQTRLTGTTYLIDKSHELLSKNLMKGLLIGIGLISLLLGLYYKSFKILLMSLVPNIIPLLAVAGYMGMTDAPLKLTTSVIFAVTFGIAVDDTIHFLAVFQRSPSRHPAYRIVNTFTSAGKAIVFTSLIIVSGFCLFMFSSFGATYYLGLFMTISLLIALLTDLTILPLLLYLFHKTRK